ncbi:MAG: CapA family protein [Cellulophaga sp.]
MKVALLGDIGFFGKYTMENPVIKEYFREVSSLLKTVDVAIGNLEVPLCSTKTLKKGKSAHIKSNPINVELLKLLNITHVSLANNHVFDYGEKGYMETKESLKACGIKYFGVENKKEYIISKDNKIALSGYVCYSTNALGYLEKNKIGVNELDYNKVKNDLFINNEKQYFSIVSFHIGEEHIHYPNINHIKLARKLSDEVPYVFYGHHPHVLQGMEHYKNSLHIYSLGNFCFDDVYTKKSKEPLVVQKKVNKESAIIILNIENNKLVNYKTVPIFDNGKEVSLPTDGAIEKKIAKYSRYLELEEKQYKNKRKKKLDEYINSRKKLRNFKWYLKRLNIDTLLMMKNSKKNTRKYKEALQDKVV